MMRKLLGLAVVALLGVLLWGKTSLNLSASSSTPGQPWMSHSTDIPVASPLVAVTPKLAVEGESIRYGQLDGQQLVGYLARPKNTETPQPAIIVIHEWWGLNDNIKAMTRRLAGEGYTALAVDLYEGKVAQTPEEARKLYTEAQNKTARLEDNLRQAYQYLEQDQKAPKIASMGWCFGGTWSLNTALLFPKQLDAAVIYYGGGIETNPDRLKALEMPILGIFGALDQNPTPETVRRFESALENLGKPVEVHIYDNADHAFANPSGTRYNAEAAEKAWNETTEFLQKYLK